ncbi:hypothetical protein SAMN04488564_11716 [Lentzea waywayandensis]|uniref:Alpha/beta hydrolase n=1 Tax=Lentzea waywayandensis TaxID=84724 RepID=A0A1I6FGQ7_9PSEU|nr:lipase family protein [Lentzea waywayandensis]SFR29092.1 hypothetical protein SAMN04488564_11716 [Lentzea waywayandensis]
MATPVFVLHGTSNRTADIIEERVAKLSITCGGKWELIPVYWGDFGAHEEWIERILPQPTQRRSEEVRGGYIPETDDDDVEQFALTIAHALEPADDQLDEQEQLLAIEAGIRAALGGDAADAVAEATADTWTADRFWLNQVSDPALLRAIGRLLAEDTAEALDEVELRDRTRVREIVRQRMQSLDELVGDALKSFASNVNHMIRTKLAPAVVRNFGDVIVYQRRWREIHDRVREVIAAVDPLLGTDSTHRVHLIGHSLGATIALDLATGAMAPESPPLWTASVITFGSPWPLFQLCDPRRPALAAIGGDEVVRLPETLNRWTNLWEPSDPLSFLAANVFRMHDGTPPMDVEVPHRYTKGANTHSIYWDAAELVTAMDRLFTT